MKTVDSDQKLAAILGMDAPPGQSQDVAADPVEAQPEQPAESAPADQPAGDVVSGTPPTEDPQLDRARTALMRSGFLASELDALDRDTLLARGLKRSDALAAEQDTFRRLRDLETRFKDSEAASAEPEQSELDGLRATLKPLQDAIADEGEATGPLAVVIAGLSERLKTLETGNVQNRQQSEMDNISASRGRLGVRYSELGDDRFFQDEVRPRMELLAKGFNDPSKTLDQRFDALLEASVRSLGISPAAPVPKEPPVANRKVETGTPLSTGQNARAAQPSPESRARLVFDMIESNKTENEIRQAVG